MRLLWLALLALACGCATSPESDYSRTRRFGLSLDVSPWRLESPLRMDLWCEAQERNRCQQ